MPLWAVVRLKMAWLCLATWLSRLQTMGLGKGRLCWGRVSDQRQYPLPRPEQQLVRGMASGQADDEPPGTPHHPARKGDQGEANCLEPLAPPLSTQYQPLHRRTQIEGQHRYGPPCSVGSEQPRGEPASRQVTLQDTMGLLALTTPLPGPPDQLIPRKGPVGHHSKDLVPSPVGEPHRGEGQPPAVPPSPAEAVRSAAP